MGPGTGSTGLTNSRLVLVRSVCWRAAFDVKKKKRKKGEKSGAIGEKEGATNSFVPPVSLWISPRWPGGGVPCLVRKLWYLSAAGNRTRGKKRGIRRRFPMLLMTGSNLLVDGMRNVRNEKENRWFFCAVLLKFIPLARARGSLRKLSKLGFRNLERNRSIYFSIIRKFCLFYLSISRSLIPNIEIQSMGITVATRLCNL